MNKELQDAIDEWQNAVDLQAASLIRSGVSPSEAIERAIRIVNGVRSASTVRKVNEIFGNVRGKQS